MSFSSTSSSSLRNSSNRSSLVSDAVGILGDLMKTLGIDCWRRIVVASVVPFVASGLWYTSRTVIEVTDDEQSLWIQMWLSHQYQAVRRVRRLMLLSPSAKMGRQVSDPWGRSRRNQANEEDDKEEGGGRFAPPKLEFQPSQGVSAWTWFGWWPVSVSAGVSNGGSTAFEEYYGRRGGSSRAGYILTVWFAPMGSAVARDLLLQGRQMWLAKRAKKTEIWLYSRSHSPIHFKIVTRPSRPLSSVIVEGNTKETIVQDAIRFLNAEQWYVGKGIPYRRGYLLHGPPGCGKTSLVTALAGHLRLPIVLVPLNNKDMDDGRLMELMGEAPRDSLVLIEDIDCALPRGADTRQSDVMMRMGRMPVTLAGLLNAIDGVGAQEGRLLFMTTNHIDRLDEALIRPGRVDIQYHLGKASRAAAGELYDQFFTSSLSAATSSSEGESTVPTLGAEFLQEAKSAFLAKVQDGAHSFAALQGVFMTARDDPRLVLIAMDNLLASTDTGNPEKRSAWDTVASMEKASKAALEKEKQQQEQQLSSGSPVVKRLTGNPTDVTHHIKKSQIMFEGFFTTIGVPDLLATSGILYYEIEILKAHGCPQFGFTKKNGFVSSSTSDETTSEGCGDNDKSWAVDGHRQRKWHDGEDKRWKCRWQEGTVVGLAANIDSGMIAVAKDGVWDNTDGKEGGELGVVFLDESIKEGVFPCFSASSFKVRYCFNNDQCQHGPPPESVWEQ